MPVFPVPGTPWEVHYEVRDGQLNRLILGGRTYLHRHNGFLVFEDGWVRTRERAVGRTTVRDVRTHREDWLETYGFNEAGLPDLVDGTHIERNALGYITSCSDAEQMWQYTYHQHHLVSLKTPHIQREIDYSGQNHPSAWRTSTFETDLTYDAAGLRLDTPTLGAEYHRDDLGRLWTISDDQGRVRHTYLWWGFACLGRIDGPPGDPLAAVFSLDAGLTPVRVITRFGMTRYMRDAFGENLNRDPRVPGLHGGIQTGRFIHYRARVLDTWLGCYTAPDPFDGSARDPRRANGFRGKVPVELPPAGVYCVCQHDPVGRMDPTGEISAGLGSFFTTLGSLTWAFQNNLTTFTTLQFWNALIGLFSFQGRHVARVFDIEGLSSKYSGAWGLRINPVGFELLGVNRRRAWTMQHAIFANPAKFDDLARARVFVPDKAYRPNHYGSVLWFQPEHGKSPSDPGADFVLCRQPPTAAPFNHQNQAPESWSRMGGIGEPLYHQASMPWFPEGGFHFTYREDVPCPVAGTVSEVHPDGELYKGSLASHRTIAFQDLESAPSKGKILLSVAEDHQELHLVRGHFKEGNRTFLVMEDPNPQEEHFLVEVYETTLASKSETFAAGKTIKHLKALPAVSASHFEKGQFLRLEGGTPPVVAAAKIEALEAELELDEPPPPPTTGPPLTVFQVKPLVQSGSVRITSKDDLVFPEDGQQPEAQSYIVIKSVLFQGIYQVSPAGSPGAFTSDRDMDPTLVSAGTAVWYPATRRTELGSWPGTTIANLLVYNPIASGQAPDQGPLLFTDSDGEVMGARNITARKSDQILLNRELPGGSVDHGVRLIEQGDCLETDAYLADRPGLVIKEPLARRTALARSPIAYLLPVEGLVLENATNPAVFNGLTLITNQKWQGQALKITQFNTSSFPLNGGSTFGPTPGQMVVLRKHGALDIERHVVSRLEMTVTFKRPPDFDTLKPLPPKGWAMNLLMQEGLYFKAIRKNHEDLVLQNQAYRMNFIDSFDTTPGIRTEEVWLPRFREGDFVKVLWQKAGVTQGAPYRIKSQAGAALTLVGGPNLPPDQDHYAVVKLEVLNSETGARHAAINGKPLTANQYRFSVWRPNGLVQLNYVLYNDKHVAVVEIDTLDQLDIHFEATSAFTSDPVDVIVPHTNGKIPTYVGRRHEVEDIWFLPQLPFIAGPDLVLIQSFRQSVEERTQRGQFSTGTTHIPDDTSHGTELDARESLETHELQHTIQSITMGPVLLTAIPLFLLDTVASTVGEGLSAPQYSAFVAGELTLENGQASLIIPDPGDLDFSSGKTVQIIQNNNSVRAKLDGLLGDGFRVAGTETLSFGQVAVRLEKSAASQELAKAHSVLEFLTVGGLQSAILGPVINKLIYSFANICSEDIFDPQGRINQPDMLPAVVPDRENPFIVEIPPLEGEAHGLEVHDYVEIEAGGLLSAHTVVSVDGDLVQLDERARFNEPNGDLTIGAIGENHPMRQYMDAIINHVGGLDIRGFFDPFGQLFFEEDPDDQSGLDWAITSLRPFYSTTSWSGLGLGGFWFDRVYATASGDQFVSFMEQDASEQSGRQYSPIGRLRGDLEYVGDLGKYHYYHDENEGRKISFNCDRKSEYEVIVNRLTLGGNGHLFPYLYFRVGQDLKMFWQDGADSSGSQLFVISRVTFQKTPPNGFHLTLETYPGSGGWSGIPEGQTSYSFNTWHLRMHDVVSLIQVHKGDAPGIPAYDFLRALPHRSEPGDPGPKLSLGIPAVKHGRPGLKNGNEPNLAAMSGAGSAQALPHELFVKNFRSPRDPQAKFPDGFAPNTLGTIPQAATVERDGGMYVAFCQPSATNKHRLTVRNEFPMDARSGRIAHQVCGTKRQTLYYDRQVKDVSVHHHGHELGHELALVFCQRATLAVSPEENRIYHVTVADPHYDPHARNVANMTLLAQTQAGTTHMELARYYDGISPPTHLNRPFYVPVRRMAVVVGNTLSFRTEEDPHSNVVTEVLPGKQAYLFIPAKLSNPDLKTGETVVFAGSPHPHAALPESNITPLASADLTEPIRDFLGSGRAFRFTFPADHPPEEPTTLTWQIPVEAGQTQEPKKITASLTCELKLNPHFRLVPQTAGDPFELPQAEGSTLILKSDPASILMANPVTITAPSISDPDTKLTAQVTNNGSEITIKTLATTPSGVYRVQVAGADDPGNQATRTFEVV